MKAFDDVVGVAVSIVMLATVAIILSKKSRTPGVISSFFKGFSHSINAAQGT